MLYLQADRVLAKWLANNPERLEILMYPCRCGLCGQFTTIEGTTWVQTGRYLSDGVRIHNEGKGCRRPEDVDVVVAPVRARKSKIVAVAKPAVPVVVRRQDYVRVTDLGDLARAMDALWGKQPLEQSA